MSEPDAALDYVHGVLRERRAGGLAGHASAESLRALAATARRVDKAPAPMEALPLPKPAARPQPSPAERPRAAVPKLPNLPGSGSKAEQLAKLREEAHKDPALATYLEAPELLIAGLGNPEAELVLIGDAPGEDDVSGEPLASEPGKLLVKIIEAMGFTRDSVYIANVLKSRTDRASRSPRAPAPSPEAIQRALALVQQQIEIIRPRAIVVLGGTALESLLGLSGPLGKLRSQWYDWRGLPVMATYHPTYLIHNTSLPEKRKLWDDMLLVLEKLQRPISEKQRGYFLAKKG